LHFYTAGIAEYNFEEPSLNPVTGTGDDNTEAMARVMDCFGHLVSSATISMGCGVANLPYGDVMVCYYDAKQTPAEY
jgi:biotin synthase-related radical SAM superfamily protein